MMISGVSIIILWIISFDKMEVNDFKNGAITGIWFGA
tara:strand:+ start:465 stop:575 length:111 start_codon:yes stop_codon:yes gene_type:complete